VKGWGGSTAGGVVGDKCAGGWGLMGRGRGNVSHGSGMGECSGE